VSAIGARALVVEDDEGERRRLSGYLRGEGLHVLEADNGFDGLSLLRRGAVDIALVDARLPQMDGLELVRRARLESTVPIILLTARGAESELISGLDTGADDYVVKPCALGEIGARVRAHLRRARGFASDSAVLQSGTLKLDLAARRCHIDGIEVVLTRREFDLLAALLRYAGRIHTRRQLLELVWGSEEITAKTIDVHVAALRRKLGSAVHIEAVRGVGYRLDAL
jgi:DNA-binding response OmpR family regulator